MTSIVSRVITLDPASAGTCGAGAGLSASAGVTAIARTQPQIFPLADITDNMATPELTVRRICNVILLHIRCPDSYDQFCCDGRAIHACLQEWSATLLWRLARGFFGALNVQENPHRESWRDRLPGDRDGAPDGDCNGCRLLRG